MGSLTLVSMPLQVAAGPQNACAAGGAFGAFEVAICQDMVKSGAKQNPDRYYRLAHLWAEKWKTAKPSSRACVPVNPAVPTSDPMNLAGIKTLAARMVPQFKTACAKACGATVYMALSHGGVELTDTTAEEKLAARKSKLEADREALRALKRTLSEKDPEYATKKKHVAKEQDRIACEDARVNRTRFPTFSLGAQRGGLHAQHLAMDYEYFIFLDHPNGGWNEKERQCYEARKAYFTELRAIFQENKIKTLHLIACEIGKDASFISRVGKELGVPIVSYAYFTVIKEVTGFIGLSSDNKTDDIVAATSVDPPTSPVVTS